MFGHGADSLPQNQLYLQSPRPNKQRIFRAFGTRNIINMLTLHYRNFHNSSPIFQEDKACSRSTAPCHPRRAYKKLFCPIGYTGKGVRFHFNHIRCQIGGNQTEAYHRGLWGGSLNKSAKKLNCRQKGTRPLIWGRESSH